MLYLKEKVFLTLNSPNILSHVARELFTLTRTFRKKRILNNDEKYTQQKKKQDVNLN